jgi:hypothetical protein
MSKNDFDELLARKLNEEALPYNPEHWQALKEKLHPKSEQKGALGLAILPTAAIWKWTGVAAAVALVIASVGIITSLDKQNGIPVAHTDTQKPQAAEVEWEQYRNDAIDRKANSATSGPVETRIAVQRIAQEGHIMTNNAYNLGDAHLYPQVVNNGLEQLETIQQLEETVMEHVQAPVVQVTPNTNAKGWFPSSSPKHDYGAPLITGLPSQDKEANTTFAINGGVNYGTLNTGYSAGVSLKQKLGGKFFVDGSVAMLYNNNAVNVAANNGPSLTDVASRPSNNLTSDLATPALDPMQKLFYVQFNPSIGYQIEKHVALSVGGDFQRMLNKKEEVVQPEMFNSKMVPNFDVGFTAKSEIAITPNIQAGVLYREGLNNLFKPEGVSYVNRRYVQVQFKYTIPLQ